MPYFALPSFTTLAVLLLNAVGCCQVVSSPFFRILGLAAIDVLFRQPNFESDMKSASKIASTGSSPMFEPGCVLEGPEAGEGG